ncbi:Wall-associated receptor kinase 3 [Olea europaea subsp. europaea]|uniref:Wall-associated receptor kinase 3 n=1 Tax=Olea europaea subsp. europaea TaxID=158383 RepID=A0A8S0PTR2_OLEEU|nr:Wall-associated receptor kinase 3 [Olea europaea subsp. europaea]
MDCFLLTLLFIVLQTLVSVGYGSSHINACRSFCGNLTIDYPFTLQIGCGHPGFRELLFCINDVLMFHISSGSYRVLDIDYTYQFLVLDDPHMSTCDAMVLQGRGNGFVVEEWRAPYLNPTPENMFMLLKCSPESPLFQGFPGKHLPCQNVSGMSCQEYFGCPAWGMFGPKHVGLRPRLGPLECCALPFEAIKAVNLSKLDCQGYSSAYSLAPLRVAGPGEWSYGIQVKYSVQGKETFCQTCGATGGSCGYDIEQNSDLCMCGSWNSTSNCDTVHSASGRRKWSLMVAIAGFMICKAISRYPTKN